MINRRRRLASGFITVSLPCFRRLTDFCQPLPTTRNAPARNPRNGPASRAKVWPHSRTGSPCRAGGVSGPHRPALQIH